LNDEKGKSRNTSRKVSEEGFTFPLFSQKA
jgi:hypothetical protein